MKVKLRFLVIGVVLGGVAVLVGVLVVLLDRGDDSVRGWPIEDARQFDEFSLFWLGEEYAGLPLTKIAYARSEKVVIFVYGSCDPGGEGGCAPPLSVRIEPCSHEPPGRSLSLDFAGYPFEIRGAQAAFVGSHLRVWTRGVTVTVYAERRLALEAAGALRLLSEGPEGADKELDPLGYPC